MRLLRLSATMVLVLLAACTDQGQHRARVPDVVGDPPAVGLRRIERAGFEGRYERPPEHCPQSWRSCRIPIDEADDLMVVAQRGTAGRLRPLGSTIGLVLTTQVVSSEPDCSVIHDVELCGLRWPPWHDRHGRPVDDVGEVAGSAHCDWQSITFFELHRRQFVRSPPRKLLRRVPGFASDAELPAHARRTQYRSSDGTKRLWLARGGRFIFIVGPRTTERWPEYPAFCF